MNNITGVDLVLAATILSIAILFGALISSEEIGVHITRAAAISTGMSSSDYISFMNSVDNSQ